MLKLFLHPVDSGKGIAALYKRAFAEAIELYVLSAYLRTWDTTLKLNERCGGFTFIIGKDFGITRKQACLDVLNWLPPHRKPFFLVADGIAGFHPKSLFWKTRTGASYSLIGSSNLSDAGWNTNYEANAFANLSAQEFKNVKAWIDEVRKRSVPMSRPWLDAYQEAPAARKPRRNARGGLAPSLSAIELPKCKRQAAIIRERQDKKRMFAKIRPRTHIGDPPLWVGQNNQWEILRYFRPDVGVAQLTYPRMGLAGHWAQQQFRGALPRPDLDTRCRGYRRSRSRGRAGN